MQLPDLCKKRKTKKARINRYQNDNLYKKNLRKCFTKLRFGSNKGKVITKHPKKEKVTTFWEGILSSKAVHNNKATWINMRSQQWTTKNRLNGLI